MGLQPGATRAEVRAKWKQLARKYHPDHNPEDPVAEAHFKDVHEAYLVLSDEIQRKSYDHRFGDSAHKETQPLHHYFFAYCRPSTVKCYEEIELIFTYSGRGTLFRKPSMPDFFVTGSPFVSQRMVLHEGQNIRETQLTYIVAPMLTGSLQIGKASITTDHKFFESEPLHVNVEPAQCAFTKNNIADAKPFNLTMHYEYLPGEEPFRVSELKKNHVVLVPRCKTAYLFHNIGSAIKIIGTIWGMIKLNIMFDINPLVGMAAGNLLGGINCYILYAIAQVKPKYMASRIYSGALEYHERGYYLGESLGIPFISGNFWFYLVRILR